jgi:hypothetical protein
VLSGPRHARAPSLFLIYAPPAPSLSSLPHTWEEVRRPLQRRGEVTDGKESRNHAARGESRVASMVPPSRPLSRGRKAGTDAAGGKVRRRDRMRGVAARPEEGCGDRQGVGGDVVGRGSSRSRVEHVDGELTMSGLCTANRCPATGNRGMGGGGRVVDGVGTRSAARASTNCSLYHWRRAR